VTRYHSGDAPNHTSSHGSTNSRLIPARPMRFFTRIRLSCGAVSPSAGSPRKSVTVGSRDSMTTAGDRALS